MKDDVGAVRLHVEEDAFPLNISLDLIARIVSILYLHREDRIKEQMRMETGCLQTVQT